MCLIETKEIGNKGSTNCTLLANYIELHTFHTTFNIYQMAIIKFICLVTLFLVCWYVLLFHTNNEFYIWDLRLCY